MFIRLSLICIISYRRIMKRFFSVFFLLCSCTSEVGTLLRDVESYIMEHPDSALTVIESVDISVLTTKKLKANHALLHAMALDKNYIDVTDDSIAQVAVDYYSRKGISKNKARAYYYLGIAYYYQKDYEKAILEFTKAEKVAELCDSLYWGMTKDIQGHTYEMTYNDKEAINCFEKAYDIYHNLLNLNKAQSVQFKLARALINNLQYEEAEKKLSALLADKSINEELRLRYSHLYAYLKIIQPKRDPQKSIELYEKFIDSEGVMTIQDYWAYAFALNLVGRNNDSREIVDELIEIDSTSTASYWLYLINKYEGNATKALSFLEESGYKDNKVITETLNQSLSLAQRDYYESQSELAEYKIKNRTLSLISVIVISILSIVVIILFITRYIRKQREEKDSYIRYADEVSRQLHLLRSEADSLPVLKRKYLELYKSKFEDLRILCDNYLQYKDRTDAERRMYGKVVSMINELRNDAGHNAELEMMLNADLDNIITNIRSEIKMKEIDYSIYCYLVIGFDATTISRLLDVSVNTIYIRKSRIKAAIENSMAEHKGQFLEILT